MMKKAFILSLALVSASVYANNPEVFENFQQRHASALNYLKSLKGSKTPEEARDEVFNNYGLKFALSVVNKIFGVEPKESKATTQH